MGFNAWIRNVGASMGRGIRTGAAYGAAAARTGMGIAWANRWEIADFALSATAAGAAGVFGATATAATGGAAAPAWTWAQAGTTINLSRSGLSLAESIAATSGDYVDPLFKRKNLAKRPRDEVRPDKVESAVAAEESAGNIGENKKPRVSADMRARMANLATV